MIKPLAPKPRIILWDLDGTLVYWESLRVIPEVAEVYLRLLGGKFPMLKACMASTRAYLRVLRNSGIAKNNELYNSSLSRSLRCPEHEIADLSRALIDGGHLDQAIRTHIRAIPEALSLVADIHSRGLFSQVVATNPVMPVNFNERRMRLAGFDPGMFLHVTGSEHYSCQKKNALFYRELLGHLNVPPEACLMIGNDVKKDLVSKRAGIPFFLIENRWTDRKDPPPGFIPDFTGDYGALRNLLMSCCPKTPER